MLAALRRMSVSFRRRAAPAFRSIAVGTYAVRKELSMARPTGVKEGDTMFCSIYLELSKAALVMSGWSLVGSQLEQKNGTLFVFATFSKVYAGETTNYVATWGGTEHGCNYRIVAYSGVNTAKAVNVTSGEANATSSATEKAPSLTTTVANTTLLYSGATSSGVLATSTPSGFTKRVDEGGLVADKVMTTVGASGPVEWPLEGSAWWIGTLIALEGV
jgi:hypothetical protein